MIESRYGVIDIGSNSILLEITDVQDNTVSVVYFDRVVTQLSASLGSGTHIDGDTMRKTVEVIDHFTHIAKQHHVKDSNLRLVATAATRIADNGDELVNLVMNTSNSQVHVITPDQEAHYSLLGVSHTHSLSNKSVAILDIGGGSTEIAFAFDGILGQVASLQLGSVSLSSQFTMHDKISQDQYTSMLRHICEMLDHELQQIPQLDTVYATGGACIALSAMELQQEEHILFAHQKLDDYILQCATITKHLEQLVTLDAHQRSKLAGISSSRAETIVAGASIAKQVIERLHVDSVAIYTGGITLGVLLEMASGN